MGQRFGGRVGAGGLVYVDEVTVCGVIQLQGLGNVLEDTAPAGHAAFVKHTVQQRHSAHGQLGVCCYDVVARFGGVL